MKNDGATPLCDLILVKEMNDQEASVFKQLLITDTREIGPAIAEWEKFKQTASGEELEECTFMISGLRAILAQRIRLTMSAYNIEISSEKKETPASKEEVNKDTTKPGDTAKPDEDKSSTEKVDMKVKRGDDLLREKYKDLIKTKNLNELEMHFKKMRDEKGMSDEDITEAITFIYGNGLYKSKKPAEKWNEQRISDLLTNRIFKEKKEHQEKQNKPEEPQTLAEKYADIANTLTLEGIKNKVIELCKSSKHFEALEMMSYLLTERLYAGSDKDGLTWTEETIKVYFEQATEGLANPNDKKEGTEEPTFDIKFNDLFKYLEEEAKKDGVTIERLKELYKKFLVENTGKKIQTITEALERDSEDTVWTNLFEQTLKHIIESTASKKAQQKFEAENATKKQTIIEEFGKTVMDAQKEKVEKGNLDKNALTAMLKTKLYDKGFVSTTIPEAREAIMNLARSKKLNVKWLESEQKQQKDTNNSNKDSKFKDNLPEKKENPKKDKKSATIIGSEISVDNQFPEVKKEVEEIKYLVDAILLLKKYKDNPDKASYVRQILAKSFFEKKMYGALKDTTPLDWNPNRVEAWFNEQEKKSEEWKQVTGDPVKKDESGKEEPAKTEPEKPVVDAETDTSKKQDDKPESTEKVTVDENPLFKVKKQEPFKTTIVEIIKSLKEKGKSTKEIDTTIIGYIKDAKRNKKSFCRSAYYNATDGELFKEIHGIAIANNIDGFMNE